MKHTEAIETLCLLHSSVHNYIDPDGQRCADCFCGKGGFWETKGYDPKASYRNDGHCVAYIVAAVKFAMRNGMTMGALTQQKPATTKRGAKKKARARR